MTVLPKLRQLSYLVALRKDLHFGHAAEACNVTQSTLSAGIQELERLLDVKLVERSKRFVRFTPLGEQVVEMARSLLDDAENLVLTLNQAREPLTNRLRLGVIPTIAPFFLPRALPPMRRAFPKLKLYLKEAMSADLCDELGRGQLDILLLALPFRCGEVEEEELFDDPFFAAIPGDGEAELLEPMEVDQLDASRLLLLEDGHCLRDHALAACSMPGFRPDRSLLGTSLHTLVQMVDNDLGITLLPQMSLEAGILKGTRIGVAPLTGSDDPTRKIGLVWRRHDPRREEFRLLADFLRKSHDARKEAG